ncbi:MAG: TMAO reductase system periplasmic protein TorT [Desulfobacteraceae bacterium]|jgi:protein TorT
MGTTLNKPKLHKRPVEPPVRLQIALGKLGKTNIKLSCAVCILSGFGLLAICWVIAATLMSADTVRRPFSVEVPDKNGESADEKILIEYVPLARAKKKWFLSVFFPHMKDSYWLAVNFGIADEVKRKDVQMRLYQAGGYDNLQVQIDQIKEAVAAGTDGVIIGAISLDGVNPLVAELHNKGIPVIDVINGMSTDQISARSLVSFEEMGYHAGNYIALRHPKGGSPVKVVWFPGPKNAGWVKAGNRGFRKALAGSAVEIAAVRYGDTGKTTQTALLEEVLDDHSDIDYVAGTAVTAVAAVKTLRARGLTNRIKVVAYYFTPEVYREIKRGHLLGAPTDSPVIQGRVAVDQLVRILEGRPFMKQVGPRIQVVDRANINTFDRTTSLAPGGFRATYSVNVQLRTE